MVEKILILIMGFILGAVFVRFWDAWRTKGKLEKGSEEIVKKTQGPNDRGLTDQKRR